MIRLPIVVISNIISRLSLGQQFQVKTVCKAIDEAACLTIKYNDKLIISRGYSSCSPWICHSHQFEWNSDKNVFVSDTLDVNKLFTMMSFLKVLLVAMSDMDALGKFVIEGPSQDIECLMTHSLPPGFSLPNLKHLFVNRLTPEVLLEVLQKCPHLVHLHVNVLNESHEEYVDFRPVLLQLPKGLKYLKIFSGHRVDLIEILSSECMNTLEFIHFGPSVHSVDHALSSKSSLKIPFALKEINFIWDSHAFEEYNGVIVNFLKSCTSLVSFNVTLEIPDYIEVFSILQGLTKIELHFYSINSEHTKCDELIRLICRRNPGLESLSLSWGLINFETWFCVCQLKNLNFIETRNLLLNASRLLSFARKRKQVTTTALELSGCCNKEAIDPFIMKEIRSANIVLTPLRR